MGELRFVHRCATMSDVKLLNWMFSSKFERFYKRQMRLLQRQPHFVLNESLQDCEAQVVTSATGSPRIEVRPTLSQREAAHAIAHEITHLVLNQEGFPVVALTPDHPDWEDCRGSLDAMLSDPLIERRLDDYSFDQEDQSKRTLRQVRRAFRKPPIQIVPKQRISWLVRLFQYVRIMLELSNSSAEEFARSYKGRYPLIAEEGEQLLSLIREWGFQTPLQCLRILQNVLDRYELGSLMVILDPRTRTAYGESTFSCTQDGV